MAFKYYMALLLIMVSGSVFQLLGQPAHSESANVSLANDCFSSNLSYAPGERITYVIYYNWNFIWIPAGEAVFTVNEFGDLLHYKAIGYTYPSYEWAYKVDDEYDSYVDKESLHPMLFERRIEEGNFRFFNRLEFDPGNQSVVSYVGKDRDNLKKKESTFQHCMNDVLSLVYNTRNISTEGLKRGDHIPTNMFIDHDQYDISIRYDGRYKSKKIKGLGYFDVIKISPELIAGNIFSEDQRMNILVSDDNNRLPLLIESPISVGSVKVVLKEYSGLKYPLLSRIK